MCESVNILDPLPVDLLLHYGPHIIVDRIQIKTVWWPKRRKYELLVCPLSAGQLSHEPYGLAHCLVETRKSLTVDRCLAEVSASVDLPDSSDR